MYGTVRMLERSDTRHTAAANNTTNYNRHLNESPQCQAHIGEVKVIYFRKQRKDGTWYNGMAVTGERCPNESNRSIRRDGQTLHRCGYCAFTNP